MDDKEINAFHAKLATKGKGAKEWTNRSKKVEYLGNGKFAVSIASRLKGVMRNGGDPSVSLSDPTEDGMIAYNREAATYTRYNASVFLSAGRSPTYTTRGYAEWDISSIPNDATITKTIFKYHGVLHGIDGHIHEMLGARPTTETDPNVWAEAGEGTIYADPAGFPEVGTGKQVDLGSSANTDLQSQLISDWFAIGIQSDDEETTASLTVYAEELATADPPPTLYVEYSVELEIPPSGDFPPEYILEGKAEDLRPNAPAGATITKVSQDFPLLLGRVGKSKELKSKVE